MERHEKKRRTACRNEKTLGVLLQIKRGAPQDDYSTPQDEVDPKV